MPLATNAATVSRILFLNSFGSWFNAFALLVFLYKRNLFHFNKIFFLKFIKIFLASIIMGMLFKYLILIFEYQLAYDFNLKSLYLMISVFLSIIFYLLFSLFIKAFKYKDIKLRY